MKPVDFRNATFESLREKLEGRRKAVYFAWVAHGPATTRQLAEKSCIDILQLRPRTTELVQLGLVELSGDAGNEGVYQARSLAAWEAWVTQQREGRVERQVELI